MGDIKEEIQKLGEIIKDDQENKNKKKRTPRLSFRSRVGIRKARKGYVGIWKINETGFITPSKQEIKEQTVMIDGVPRLATPEYVLRYKKGFRTYPIMLVPSWSVKPVEPSKLSKEGFNPAEEFKKSMKDGSNIKGYRLLMNRMKTEAIGATKKGGFGIIKWVIGLGLAAIIGYAILTGGGG